MPGLAKERASRKLWGGLASLARIAFLAMPCCVCLACSHTHRQPPGVPPTPKSISREEPGGDAFDPHLAALQRLAKEPFGWRNDKRDTFHFPLTDWKNWRRVRFWGVPTFVGFRYGDKHRAIAGMRVYRLKDEVATPETCLQTFERWAVPIADSFSASVKDQTEVRLSWRTKDDVLVRSLEADVRTLLSQRRYFGVVGATLAWPAVCAVYGYAFEIEDHEEIARQTRDRYAAEAFRKLVRLPDNPPEGID